jgi:hypothetical protein
MLARFDGSSDPVEFLQLYSIDGQLVPDGCEGRDSLMALGVAPEIHLVLERSLRVLHRQVRSSRARA